MHRITHWLPPVLMAIGIICNFFAGFQFIGAPFFVAAPLAAAPFSSGRRTAVLGLLSLLLLGGLLAHDPDTPILRDGVLMSTTAVVVLLSLGINLIARRRGAALDSARDIAEAAQLAVLPEPPSRLGPFDIAARYRAAQEGANIGGDLYAVQKTPYGVRMIMGDVRGKGMGAVETIAVVLGAFREAAEREETLEDVAGRLDHALHREGERRRGVDDFEGFTTAVLAEVPPGDPGRLRIVNRGHPPPLLLGNGSARFLRPSDPALPLGMSDLGEWRVTTDEFRLPENGFLLLYTDGLSEARNREGDFYEPDVRLNGSVFESPDHLLSVIISDVAAHTGGAQEDDMALMGVQRRRS